MQRLSPERLGPSRFRELSEFAGDLRKGISTFELLFELRLGELHFHLDRAERDLTRDRGGHNRVVEAGKRHAQPHAGLACRDPCHQVHEIMRDRVELPGIGHDEARGRGEPRVPQHVDPGVKRCGLARENEAVEVSIQNIAEQLPGAGTETLDQAPRGLNARTGGTIARAACQHVPHRQIDCIFRLGSSANGIYAVKIFADVVQTPTRQLQTRLQETGPEFQPLYGAELTKFIDDEQKFWLPLAKKYAT